MSQVVPRYLQVVWQSHRTSQTSPQTPTPTITTTRSPSMLRVALRGQAKLLIFTEVPQRGPATCLIRHWTKRWRLSTSLSRTVLQRVPKLRVLATHLKPLLITLITQLKILTLMIAKWSKSSARATKKTTRAARGTKLKMLAMRIRAMLRPVKEGRGAKLRLVLQKKNNSLSNLVN